ncbi:hypothetical protein D3C72_1644030 [compost metagenome]
MADVLLVLSGKQLGVDMARRQGADGERRHEFLRPARHDRPDRRAAFAQAPDEVEALVGGDAARDYENDALARQGHASGVSLRAIPGKCEAASRPELHQNKEIECFAVSVKR